MPIMHLRQPGFTYRVLPKKPYFLLPNVLKRWSFPKNCTGIWSFLYYQERWYFFFPKNIILFFGKWKMIFLKKIHWNMIFSSNILKRWSFQKNSNEIWSFLHYLGRGIVFFRTKNKRWSFSRNTWKCDIFCIYG